MKLKDLEKVDACEEARGWFVKEFPKGTTKTKALAACPRGDWLIWALWNFKSATIEQIILLGLTAGRRSLRFAREQDKAVLVAAYDAAEKVADNNTPENRNAAAASASSAARSAASAESASSAARSAAAAAWSAAAAESASSAEHLAVADDLRTLMKTARYKRIGKTGRGR